MIDYNEISWKDIFYYDSTSPSGLRWLADSGWKHFGDIAGSRAWNDKEKNKPKCWDVRYNGKLYKAHRIIWILVHGSIDNHLVINHKDNNPHNNLIENLELVSQEINMRKCKVHNWEIVQPNNSSGINGVAIMTKGGEPIAYSATSHDPTTGQRTTIQFSISRYGTELAKRLAETARDFLIDKLSNKGINYGENFYE